MAPPPPGLLLVFGGGFPLPPPPPQADSRITINDKQITQLVLYFIIFLSSFFKNYSKLFSQAQRLLFALISGQNFPFTFINKKATG